MDVNDFILLVQKLYAANPYENNCIYIDNQKLLNLLLNKKYIEKNSRGTFYGSSFFNQEYEKNGDITTGTELYIYFKREELNNKLKNKLI